MSLNANHGLCHIFCDYELFASDKYKMTSRYETTVPMYIVGVPNQTFVFSAATAFKASPGLKEGCGNTSLAPLFTLLT